MSRNVFYCRLIKEKKWLRENAEKNNILNFIKCKSTLFIFMSYNVLNKHMCTDYVWTIIMDVPGHQIASKIFFFYLNKECLYL